ncbi:response regulator [Nocardia asteroides]|uniref:response regulator n=1 Tax=Nocardia asteroides TaxID=1824 RepID=UPI001E64F7C4|nr:response regulator transcription factor [Nocardia asteroides]UGT62501.1 response regulator transcription factor [Nocardia asteroides]
MNDPYPARCLIVDDNPTFCAKARSLLEDGGIAVVGTASSLRDAVALVRSARPDLALVDIDLGAESGFDVVEALHAEPVAPLALVLMSTHDELEFADLIEASPAVGFVPKFAFSTELIRRIVG